MDVAQKIAHGAHIISQGGVIVCPTEGVYGLSALANDSKAIERIIQIKHRALNKGLIIVASNLTMLQGLVDFTKLNDGGICRQWRAMCFTSALRTRSAAYRTGYFV